MRLARQPLSTQVTRRTGVLDDVVRPSARPVVRSKLIFAGADGNFQIACCWYTIEAWETALLVNFLQAINEQDTHTCN